MQLLEYFYDRNNSIPNYHQRKQNIPNSNRVLLYGSPASGKSYLVLGYLMSYNSEETLYIDFRDPKFQFRDMMEEDIEGFIEANEIEILTYPKIPINGTAFLIKVTKDGKKLKMLKRHLKTAYNMTPDQYRERWGLSSD